MFDRHHAVWPENMPRHLSLPQTSLYTNLEVSALRYPQRDAINYYDSPITFAQLKQQVDDPFATRSKQQRLKSSFDPPQPQAKQLRDLH